MSAFAVPDWNELADAREHNRASRMNLAAATEEHSPECSCGQTAEVERLTIRLAKANMLLKAIRRVEPKPARAESADEDANELAVIGHAAAIATIRARIDLYMGRG